MTNDIITNDTVASLFKVADTVANEFGAPPIVAIGLHAAEGLIGELRRESDGSVRLVQAREQAAGASANKAAHLAGLREALLRLPLPRDASAAEQDKYVDAIMAEVARRMP